MTERIPQLFARAADQHRGGQLYEAARLYRQILELDPSHADALHLLGVVALQRSRPEEAISLIERAIAQNARVPAFHNNLGNALRAFGQPVRAVAAFRQALALSGEVPDTRYNLAVVLQETGALDEAETAYRQVLRARPAHAAAHTNLGNVLQAQGRYTEALGCFESALRAQANFLPALINRSNVLKLLGRLDEAVEGYRRALALSPQYAPAHNNLGLALQEAGQTDEALAAFEQAVALDANYAEALRNLGNALRERGRPTEAVARYQGALSLNANDAEARLGLAMAAIPVFADGVEQSQQAPAAFETALSVLEAWSTAAPERLGAAVGSLQPFYLAYRPLDITGPLARYGRLACQAAAAHRGATAVLRAPGEAAADRIRVAVVCGHVRGQHPVWDVLLRGVLAHLPRERLDLWLYHTGAHVDAETQWARTRVDRFVQGPLPISAWVATLQRDRPDVIVYPEVGMDPVTVALAALRLAPLQVAAWGHPVTTGLPTVDLFLSGELLEAAQADAHYVERLIRLPGTGVCTQALDEAAEPWDVPRATGETVRFVLPHQPIKFDPGDDRLLARIAAATGPCEFWIPAPARLGWAARRLHERLARVFSGAGLDPERHLRRAPWLPRAQFLGLLDAMDVYLDCAAFSGYTTAWQAVQRGIPIVTLEGAFLRQRLAAGLLRQIGRTEGIARSCEDYVNKAVACAAEARDAGCRARLRVLLRQAGAGANDNRAVPVALAQVLIQAADIARQGGGRIP